VVFDFVCSLLGSYEIEDHVVLDDLFFFFLENSSAAIRRGRSLFFHL
jgi:hypothetical protein